MTNKLVVIINSLKVAKIKKILLYEMKFLVSNYGCLQNPWLGGYRPQVPVLSVLCLQMNLLNPPSRTKFLGTPLSITEVEIRTYTGHKPFNFANWDVLTVEFKPTETQYLSFQSYSAAIEYPASSDVCYKNTLLLNTECDQPRGPVVRVTDY